MENQSGADGEFTAILEQHLENDEPKKVSEHGVEKKVTQKDTHHTGSAEKGTEKNTAERTEEKKMAQSAGKNRVHAKAHAHLVVRGWGKQKSDILPQLRKSVSPEKSASPNHTRGVRVKKNMRSRFPLLRGKKIRFSAQAGGVQKGKHARLVIMEGTEGKETHKRSGKVKTLTQVRAKNGMTKGESFSGPEPRMDIFAKILRGNPDQNSSSSPKNRMNAGSELTVASERYEQSIPKLVMKQNTTVSKSAEEMFNEIVRQFSLTAKNGGGEARIVLQPEVLGKIKMDLKLNDHRINSLFVVENQSIKDLILSRLNILENSLLQQGFSLGSFQVEVKEKNMGMPASEQGFTRKDGGGYNGDEEQENLVQVSSVTLPWISTVVNVTA